jgi:hypothetical protein
VEVSADTEPLNGSGVSEAAGAAPWRQDAGYLRDEPLYERWRELIEEYRRKLDEDPDAL